MRLTSETLPDDPEDFGESGTSREQDLYSAVDALAGIESRFTDRFYALLFERRPDTRSLFGAYPLSEQEEMMRETLRSIIGLLEGSPWLAGNLRALGESQAEYGVTSDMYASFIEVMHECAVELLGEVVEKPALEALSLAIVSICEMMDPSEVDAKS